MYSYSASIYCLCAQKSIILSLWLILYQCYPNFGTALLITHFPRYTIILFLFTIISTWLQLRIAHSIPDIDHFETQFCTNLIDTSCYLVLDITFLMTQCLHNYSDWPTYFSVIGATYYRPFYGLSSDFRRFIDCRILISSSFHILFCFFKLQLLNLKMVS